VTGAEGEVPTQAEIDKVYNPDRLNTIPTFLFLSVCHRLLNPTG
jgi:hypothetical protein